MRHVVQNAIDEALAAAPAERANQLDVLRAAFIPWLATINPDNDQPMRRVARYADLPEHSRPLIDALVEKRLLVKDERDGEVVVEVALESLLRQWNELASWLDEEREDLKAADALERAAAEWDKNRRDEAWLLTGTRLADAETLSAKPGFADRLKPTNEFLHASRQRENELIEAKKRQQEAELRAAIELAAAQTAAKDALAAQLDTQASAVFSRAIAGSDIRALADTLAAQRIRSDPAASRSAFYTATTGLNTTRIIIPTPVLGDISVEARWGLRRHFR